MRRPSFLHASNASAGAPATPPATAFPAAPRAAASPAAWQTALPLAGSRLQASSTALLGGRGRVLAAAGLVLAALVWGEGRAATAATAAAAVGDVDPVAAEASAEYGRQLDKLIAAAAHGGGGGQESDGARMTRFFDLYWKHAMAESPEGATQLGFPGYDDRWSDLSQAAIDRERALAPLELAAIGSIDRAKLSAAEQLDYDLFLRRARLAVDGNRFPGELMQVTQVSGIQQWVPDLLAVMPARNVKQYENIVARLHRLPRLIEQTIALLDRGLAAGVTPPRITLRDVPGQIDVLLVDDPAKSPMLQAFAKFPEAVPAADRERLRSAAYAAFRDDVVPAYRKLRVYLADTYVPHARETIGMSALPDGHAWYAFNVRAETTTELTPEQIHQIGLSEVKRIRAEMDEQMAKAGWKGSFADFKTFLRTDPRFFYDRPEDLLVAYRDICKRIDPQLIKLFGKLPRLPYGVLPVPAYSEKSQTTAYYSGGSLKAGRAGTFFANTYDLKSRPKWEMEALTLHEAVPGHHLQLSLAEEVEGGPEWRRYDGYTAYVEGWGLYAESLGGELGLYTDPYAKFGQLTYEIWRAIRLVVDTGIHSMGWSRQQAIDYFMENAAKAEHDITVEVDRYIVWPGQALAYKLGELKIKELRAFAEHELGQRFDERAFHDHLLGSGALPLDVLDRRMRAWVAAEGARRVGGGAAAANP